MREQVEDSFLAGCRLGLATSSRRGVLVRLQILCLGGKALLEVHQVLPALPLNLGSHGRPLQPGPVVGAAIVGGVAGSLVPLVPGMISTISSC